MLSSLNELRDALSYPVEHDKAIGLVGEILKDKRPMPRDQEELPVLVYPGLFAETTEINDRLKEEQMKEKENESKSPSLEALNTIEALLYFELSEATDRLNPKLNDYRTILSDKEKCDVDCEGLTLITLQHLIAELTARKMVVEKLTEFGGPFKEMPGPEKHDHLDLVADEKEQQ